MPTVQRQRSLAASQQELWELISDPQHMPRWWPGVDRMEAVESDRWTQVFKTQRGRPIRADFRLIQSDPPWRRAWEQAIPGTPFQRVLNELIVEVRLEPVAGRGTEVTIVQSQKLRGYSRTGGLIARGAAKRQLDEALAGLHRICG